METKLQNETIFSQRKYFLITDHIKDLYLEYLKVKWSHSVLSDSLPTPWTVAYKAPLSMEFSRQEYWRGLPFPSPGDLPHPGIEPGSLALQADALSSEPPGKLSQRKAMPKNDQTTAKLHSSHTLVKQRSKFSKPTFNSTWTMNFQKFKLDLEKAEEPEIKLPTFVGSWRKQGNSRKTPISASLT